MRTQRLFRCHQGDEAFKVPGLIFPGSLGVQNARSRPKCGRPGEDIQQGACDRLVVRMEAYDTAGGGV